MDRRVVQLVVKDRSSGIFDCVLDSGNEDDDNERCGVEARASASKYLEYLKESADSLDADILPYGTYTKNNDEQEIDVGDVVELKPQVFRYESQCGVFGGSYLVARIVDFWFALLVSCALGKGPVEVDRPAIRLLVLRLLMIHFAWLLAICIV